jgi:hypothetical protein
MGHAFFFRTPEALIPQPGSGKKMAAPVGAAKFREETSGTQKGAVCPCCIAQYGCKLCTRHWELMGNGR